MEVAINGSPSGLSHAIGQTEYIMETLQADFPKKPAGLLIKCNSLLNELGKNPIIGPLITSFILKDPLTAVEATIKYNLQVLKFIITTHGQTNDFLNLMLKLINTDQLVQAVSKIDVDNTSRICFKFVNCHVLSGIFSNTSTAKEKEEYSAFVLKLPIGYFGKLMPRNEEQKFKDDIYNKYLPALEEFQEWCLPCRVLIHCCGEILHHNVVLTNKILKIVECGFKKRTVEDRCASFECWKTLIDNYKQNKSYFNSSKQIRLLVKPLKAKLSKNPIVTVKRFEIYSYFIFSLDDPYPALNDFLTACLGPFDEPIGAFQPLFRIAHIRDVNTLCPRITETFLAILGHNKVSCKFHRNYSVLNCGTSLEWKAKWKDSDLDLLMNCAKACTILNYQYKIFLGKPDTLVEVQCIWESLLKFLKPTTLNYLPRILDTVENLLLEGELDNHESSKIVLKHVFDAVFKHLVEVNSSKSSDDTNYSYKLIKFLCKHDHNGISFIYPAVKMHFTILPVDKHYKKFLTEIVKIPSNLSCECLIEAFIRLEYGKKIDKEELGDSVLKTIIDMLSEEHVNLKSLPMRLINVMKRPMFQVLRPVVIHDEKFIIGAIKFCVSALIVTTDAIRPIYGQILDTLAHHLVINCSDNIKKDIKKMITMEVFEKIFTLRKRYWYRKDDMILTCIIALVGDYHMHEFAKFFNQFSPELKFPGNVILTLRKWADSDHCSLATYAKLALDTQNVAQLALKCQPNSSMGILLNGPQNSIKGSFINKVPVISTKKSIVPAPVAKKKESLEDLSEKAFVKINTEVVFDKRKMTEHQREAISKRRSDIPALYNDTSQQSQSTDGQPSAVNAESIFKAPISKEVAELDDNAMDAVIATEASATKDSSKTIEQTNECKTVKNSTTEKEVAENDADKNPKENEESEEKETLKTIRISHRLKKKGDSGHQEDDKHKIETDESNVDPKEESLEAGEDTTDYKSKPRNSKRLRSQSISERIAKNLSLDIVGAQNFQNLPALRYKKEKTSDASISSLSDRCSVTPQTSTVVEKSKSDNRVEADMKILLNDLTSGNHSQNKSNTSNTVKRGWRKGRKRSQNDEKKSERSEERVARRNLLRRLRKNPTGRKPGRPARKKMHKSTQSDISMDTNSSLESFESMKNIEQNENFDKSEDNVKKMEDFEATGNTENSSKLEGSLNRSQMETETFLTDVSSMKILLETDRSDAMVSQQSKCLIGSPHNKETPIKCNELIRDTQNISPIQKDTTDEQTKALQIKFLSCFVGIDKNVSPNKENSNKQKSPLKSQISSVGSPKINSPAKNQEGVQNVKPPFGILLVPTSNSKEFAKIEESVQSGTPSSEGRKTLKSPLKNQGNDKNILPIQKEKTEPPKNISSSSNESQKEILPLKKRKTCEIVQSPLKKPLSSIAVAEEVAPTDNLLTEQVESSTPNLKTAGSRSVKLLNLFVKPANVTGSPKSSRIQQIILKCDELKSNSGFKEVTKKPNEKILTFNREVPSPLATPKTSILKRKAADAFEKGVTSPRNKRRRVNFSDPPTTSEKIYFVTDKSPESHLNVNEASDLNEPEMESVDESLKLAISEPTSPVDENLDFWNAVDTFEKECSPLAKKEEEKAENLPKTTEEMGSSTDNQQCIENNFKKAKGNSSLLKEILSRIEGMENKMMTVQNDMLNLMKCMMSVKSDIEVLKD